jgi:hypothetical protein
MRPARCIPALCVQTQGCEPFQQRGGSGEIGRHDPLGMCQRGLARDPFAWLRLRGSGFPWRLAPYPPGMGMLLVLGTGSCQQGTCPASPCSGELAGSAGVGGGNALSRPSGISRGPVRSCGFAAQRAARERFPRRAVPTPRSRPARGCRWLCEVGLQPALCLQVASLTAGRGVGCEQPGCSARLPGVYPFVGPSRHK